MATEEQVRDTINRLVAAFNDHNSVATGLIHDLESVVYDPGHLKPLSGRPAIEREAADWFASAPDVYMIIERLWVSRDGACAELVMTGTQSGALNGQPPTNRPFRQTAVATWRFNDAGAIAEERRYYDPADIRAQLGAPAS